MGVGVKGNARYGDGMESARRLMSHLRSGGAPAATDIGVRLGYGEEAFGMSQLSYARYASLTDAPYASTTLLGLGSLRALAVTALGSAAWNSHRRRQAERRAAAQWRPLGWTTVAVTSARILVLDEARWQSIWLEQIFQVVPRLDRFELDLLFEEAPAVRFAGPEVPLIAVLLAYLLSDEIALPVDGPAGLNRSLR